MSERLKAFWLGLFLVGAFAVILWLILFLRPTVGDGRKELHVRFSNIERISVGSRVHFGGNPVGEVIAIKMVRDPREAPADKNGNLYLYELTLKVDSSVNVFSYDDITAATSGLLGEKVIAIIPKVTPPGAAPAVKVNEDLLFAKSEDRTAELMQKVSLLADNLSHTTSKVDSFLDEIKERGLVESLGCSFDNLCQITGGLAGGDGTFGRLICDDSLACHFAATMTRFEILLSDLNKYGLLYQFNSAWKRERLCRECDCQQPLLQKNREHFKQREATRD